MRILSKPSIIVPILLLTIPAFTLIPAFRNRPSRKSIGMVATPTGFHREMASSEFGAWLRSIALHPDNHVYLYNGQLKQYQGAHVAVLDIPVGRKDLQQCADACMRLRAEYLRAMGRMTEIWFRDNANRIYKPNADCNVAQFEAYLEKVYTYCGTISLEKQMKRIPDHQSPAPGDVLIKGGSPGHAVMVVDMAFDALGQPVYLLAQSYMPAQQIHILRNPTDPVLSPWYRLQPGATIITPEWTFREAIFRRW